jgi:hypothetical protein
LKEQEAVRTSRTVVLRRQPTSTSSSPLAMVRASGGAIAYDNDRFRPAPL